MVAAGEHPVGGKIPHEKKTLSRHSTIKTLCRKLVICAPSVYQCMLVKCARTVSQRVLAFDCAQFDCYYVIDWSGAINTVEVSRSIVLYTVYRPSAVPSFLNDRGADAVVSVALYSSVPAAPLNTSLFIETAGNNNKILTEAPNPACAVIQQTEQDVEDVLQRGVIIGLACFSRPVLRSRSRP